MYALLKEYEYSHRIRANRRGILI